MILYFTSQAVARILRVTNIVSPLGKVGNSSFFSTLLIVVYKTTVTSVQHLRCGLATIQNYTYTMKLIFQIIILLAFSQYIHAQKNSPLIGNWLDYDIECPDIITFHNNGKYFISNECYETETEKFYESGTWAIDLKKKILGLLLMDIIM